MSAPSIAVVIVNWNSRDDVLAALRHLAAQTDPDLEVVVVDNGSADGSAEAIARAFPAVRVVETGANLGFAEGCNRGIEVARADWIFLHNNDATAEPDCVARLRAAAAAAPDDVGMLQPLLLFSNHPTHVNSSGVLLGDDGRPLDRHFGQLAEAVRGAGDPFCATAGAALYRRSMLEAVRLPTGYLSRDFFMYYEDADLGWRCRLAGWRALFVPEARVRHRYAASSRRRGSTFVATQCRVNRIALLAQNASLPFIARTWPATAADLRSIREEEGRGPLAALARRVPSLLRNRRAVGRMAQVARREVERDWASEPVRATPDPRLAGCPEVQEMVPGTARRIVEVGCAIGALGAAVRAGRTGVEVRGIEPDPDAAALARASLDDAVEGPLDGAWPAGWPAPDCILLADVLPRLVDPWSALAAWRGALSPGGHLVASLPNVGHWEVLEALARGRWDYGEEGPVRRSHLRFFTRATAVEMIEAAGFEVEALSRVVVHKASVQGNRLWRPQVNRGLALERDGAPVPAETLRILDRCTRTVVIRARAR